MQNLQAGRAICELLKEESICATLLQQGCLKIVNRLIQVRSCICVCVCLSVCLCVCVCVCLSLSLMLPQDSE
jgi:hypothetical protein